MSAVAQVVEAVKKRGEATAAQIAPDLPGLTHRQVLQALENAKTAKKVAVKVRGSFKANRPTVWIALDYVPKLRARQKPRLKPAASVFGMADREPIEGVWPPPFEMARKFNLLGGWDA